MTDLAEEVIHFLRTERAFLANTRRGLILGSLAAMVAVALLIARKPWEWNVPASRGMRIADYVGVYSWWAGAANCLLMVASGRERAVVDAALPWRPIPSSAAIFPALVLAPDHCGHASLRLVWRAAPSS